MSVRIVSAIFAVAFVPLAAIAASTGSKPAACATAMAANHMAGTMAAHDGMMAGHHAKNPMHASCGAAIGSQSRMANPMAPASSAMSPNNAPGATH